MEINNNHPVIYLRGIQYVEIESILQFIYLGEAKFYEARMNEFLSVSKNLEIQELSKTDPSYQNQDFATEADNVDHNKTIQEELESVIESDEKEVTSREIKSAGSKFQCPHCVKLFSHNRNVAAHIRSVHEGLKYACNQCDYQATQQGNLTTHILSKHEGVKYACNQCDQTFTQQSNLMTHIKRKHLQ